MRKIVFFLILFFLIVSLVRNTLEYRKSLSYYQETKANLTAAVEKNKELLLKKTTAGSAFEIEKNLRNNENLLREGETMIIVPSPSPTPTPVAAPKRPPYREWISVFFE